MTIIRKLLISNKLPNVPLPEEQMPGWKAGWEARSPEMKRTPLPGMKENPKIIRTFEVQKIREKFGASKAASEAASEQPAKQPAKQTV